MDDRRDIEDDIDECFRIEDYKQFNQQDSRYQVAGAADRVAGRMVA